LAKKIVAVPEGYTIRLPRDGEWERASRGTDGREYPVGRRLQQDRRQHMGQRLDRQSGLGGTTAVCTFPQGVSPTDAWDMSGNAWEWTGSWYDDEKKYRIVRGGSWIGYQWLRVRRSATGPSR
jgi:formylglycine-generating enzyme required for sulfatase activity